MPFKKIPLKELVEQNGVPWAEFLIVAELPKELRPPFRYAGNYWKKDERTVKAWLRRYDGGERG